MDSSIHPNNVVINATNDMLRANYIPGRFVANSVCFGDITQQEMYYIILVSTCKSTVSYCLTD